MRKVVEDQLEVRRCRGTQIFGVPEDLGLASLLVSVLQNLDAGFSEALNQLAQELMPSLRHRRQEFDVEDRIKRGKFCEGHPSVYAGSALVGGRSIATGNGNVIQSQVDAQLGAVVDHVVDY